MTSNVDLTSSRRHAPRARLLALVLLLFIAYGATAEAAHTHGKLSPSRPANESTSFSDPRDRDSSTRKSPGDSGCLICQLHQNLYSTVLGVLPYTAPPPVQLPISQATVASYLSPADTPRRGRAPPTSLS